MGGEGETKEKEGKRSLSKGKREGEGVRLAQVFPRRHLRTDKRGREGKIGGGRRKRGEGIIASPLTHSITHVV